jgi:hypothetical protein
VADRLLFTGYGVQLWEIDDGPPAPYVQVGPLPPPDWPEVVIWWPQALWFWDIEELKQ